MPFLTSHSPHYMATLHYIEHFTLPPPRARGRLIQVIIVSQAGVSDGRYTMAPLQRFPPISFDISLLGPVSVTILFCMITFLTMIACGCCWKKQQKKQQPDCVINQSMAVGGASSRYQQVTAIFAHNMFRISAMPILKGARSPSCVISPFALQAAFGICMMGSEEATKVEMANTFFPNSACAQDFLKEMMEATKKCRESGFFKVFLRVYAFSGFKYSDDFQASVKTIFGSQPFVPVDYRKSHGEAMAKTTHQWLASTTRNRLTHFESSSWHPVNETKSSLCVVSAAVLNCQWTQPFYQHHTRQNKPFFLKVGKSIKLDIMRQTSTFGYYDNEQVQVLRLEYKDSDMAAYIFLPRVMGDYQRLEAKMTPDSVMAMCRSAKGRKQMVQVTLPKFKMECEMGDSLVVALASLGLVTSFKSGEANFSQMLDTKGRKAAKSPWISGAVHKVMIEFTDVAGDRPSLPEESLKSLSISVPTGTGSSAVSVGSARDGVEFFRADHPFLFFIVVEPKMTPLFYGRFCGV